MRRARAKDFRVSAKPIASRGHNYKGEVSAILKGTEGCWGVYVWSRLTRKFPPKTGRTRPTLRASGHAATGEGRSGRRGRVRVLARTVSKACVAVLRTAFQCWPGRARDLHAPQVGAGVRPSPRAGHMGPGYPHVEVSGVARFSGGRAEVGAAEEEDWDQHWSVFAVCSNTKCHQCKGWRERARVSPHWVWRGGKSEGKVGKGAKGG